MNEEINQELQAPEEQIALGEEQVQPLTPDEAAASLAFANRLQEQMLEAQNPQQGEQMAQEDEGMGEQPETEQPEMEAEEETEEPEEEGKEEPDMKSEMESFKGEVKGIIETKMDDLTKTIKDALRD